MILDTRDDFEIDEDKSRLDRVALHGFLAESYWSQGIPREAVERSIEGSDCFGLYKGDQLAGFGRVVTDGAIFGYLCDVFVFPEFRGNGLGKWLVNVIMDRPHYKTFRRWVLATRDAHDLYKPFGFDALADPSKFMEIRRSNAEIYGAASTSTK